MDYDIDDASFGDCLECGDEIRMEKVTEQEAQAMSFVLHQRGGTCQNCADGSTPFEKQIRYQILQRLGPTASRTHIATITEPHNSSYALVTLKDGRSTKIFRHGESTRQLAEEVAYALSRDFPDLKRVENSEED